MFDAHGKISMPGFCIVLHRGSPYWFFIKDSNNKNDKEIMINSTKEAIIFEFPKFRDIVAFWVREKKPACCVPTVMKYFFA